MSNSNMWKDLSNMWENLPPLSGKFKNNELNLNDIPFPNLPTGKSGFNLHLNTLQMMNQNKKIFFISMEDSPEIDKEMLLKMESCAEKEKIMKTLNIEPKDMQDNHSKTKKNKRL